MLCCLGRPSRCSRGHSPVRTSRGRGEGLRRGGGPVLGCRAFGGRRIHFWLEECFRWFCLGQWLMGVLWRLVGRNECACTPILRRRHAQQLVPHAGDRRGGQCCLDRLQIVRLDVGIVRLGVPHSAKRPPALPDAPPAILEASSRVILCLDGS